MVLNFNYDCRVKGITVAVNQITKIIVSCLASIWRAGVIGLVTEILILNHFPKDFYGGMYSTVKESIQY